MTVNLLANLKKNFKKFETVWKGQQYTSRWICLIPNVWSRRPPLTTSQAALQRKSLLLYYLISDIYECVGSWILFVREVHEFTQEKVFFFRYFNIITVTVFAVSHPHGFGTTCSCIYYHSWYISRCQTIVFQLKRDENYYA